ncbi:lactosylceramide alpha-2,3-sialyltransferase, partial [Eucyclogobius newberryi]|uniref:lactosylceramide alpha-2,3-sialyltransferase n=1 Tax=Eucyclogobius newberryi TaxID=166745 RepID=UPI003B5A6FB4
RLLLPCALLSLVALLFASLPLLLDPRPPRPLEWHVDPAHRQLVHAHVRSVLGGACRRRRTRQDLLALLPDASKNTRPLLWRDDPLPEELFLYPPPFGFKGLRGRVADLLRLLPESSSRASPGECSRCVVVGNGGILRGLELGPLIDQFDTVIRLNSGPLDDFVLDVGNRTGVRLSYPESTPSPWADSDPSTVFVAVVFKGVDLSWISAMIQKVAVPLWDRLFFWQKVPAHVAIESGRFRLLNPDVIRETALELLKYPPPRPRLWGWDPNVPTLGVTAITLASLLCDQVSVAGFGYALSQQGAPLHYYDNLAMDSILRETMHDVGRETELLRRLVRAGTIADLTGGIVSAGRDT